MHQRACRAGVKVLEVQDPCVVALEEQICHLNTSTLVSVDIIQCAQTPAPACGPLHSHDAITKPRRKRQMRLPAACLPPLWRL